MPGVKPCPECDGPMTFKNKSKKMCDDCRIDARYQKQEERKFTEYEKQKKKTEWDCILERFKGRRTAKGFEDMYDKLKAEEA